MLRSHIKPIILGLVVLITLSCSKENEDINSDFPAVDLVSVEGQITISNIDDVDISTLSVISAVSEGTIEETTTGLTYSILVNANESQLISIMAGDRLLSMAIIEEGIPESYEISPSSTAIALILTNSFLVSSNKENVSILRGIITTNPLYDSYIESVKNAITSNGLVLDSILEKLEEIITTVFDLYFNEGVFSEKGLDTLNVDFAAGKFQLMNNRRRWLKTTVSTENLSSPQLLDIQQNGRNESSIYIESTSVFENLFEGVKTDVLSVKNMNNQPFVINCYGFGKNIPSFGSTEWSEGFDAGMHTVFYDIVLETVSIIAGINRATVKDLRGRPNKGSSALNKLFDSLKNKMASRQNEIYQALSTRDTDKLLEILKKKAGILSPM